MLLKIRNTRFHYILSHNPFEYDQFTFRTITTIIYKRKIHKFTQGLDVWQILTLGVLLKKSYTKSTQDIVKSLCANLLHIKKKICSQGYSSPNIFVGATFF